MPKIDIGIACSPAQSHNWWVPIMSELLREQKAGIEIGAIRAVGSALPDHNKNYVLGNRPEPVAPENEKRRNDLTDSNRMNVTKGFLDGEADYIFWLDDDTVPPKGALSQLINLGREMVAGVYYLGKPPHNVIAYQRVSDGTYASVLDYVPGSLIEVDSVGMGCTLIHRSVYEKIMSAYKVFQRPNGSLMPVPIESVLGGNGTEKAQTMKVVNGTLYMPLQERHPDDKRPWPFYALEYGRTEDHHFCEMVRHVGIDIYVDTTIVCDHWKLKAVNRQAHKMAVQQLKGGRK